MRTEASLKFLVNPCPKLSNYWNIILHSWTSTRGRSLPTLTHHSVRSFTFNQVQCDRVLAAFLPLAFLCLFVYISPIPIVCLPDWVWTLFANFVYPHLTLTISRAARGGLEPIAANVYKVYVSCVPAIVASRRARQASAPAPFQFHLCFSAKTRRLFVRRFQFSGSHNAELRLPVLPALQSRAGGVRYGEGGLWLGSNLGLTSDLVPWVQRCGTPSAPKGTGEWSTRTHTLCSC